MAAVPAIVCYLLLGAVRWYVSGFVVAPISWCASVPSSPTISK